MCCFSRRTQMTLSDDLTFSDICEFLDKVRGSGKTDLQEKASIIKKFYVKCRSSCTSDEQFQSEMEPFNALFLPDSNESRKFDLGEKRLAALVCRIFVIEELNVSFSTMSAGQVAIALAKAVASRISSKKSAIPIREFCEHLDRICAGRKETRDTELQSLTQKCSESELVWLFNIIMRNVETFAGYSRRSFLAAVSLSANDAWANTRDLRAVAGTVDDSERPQDFFLGANFCPMLLARLTGDEIDAQVNANLGGGFFMETKYDGEHVILHKRGDQYKWFTRNGKDFTENYGSNSREKLAGRIHPIFKSSLKDCIIDCELMHFEEATGKLIRHMDKSSLDREVLNYRNPQVGHRIVVVVFDMLYFGGVVNKVTYQEDLTRTPLSDRVEVMADRLLKRNEPDNIFISERVEGKTGDDIRSFFNQAMEDKQEGIAVKRKDSLYFVGKRAKANGWFKLKDRFDMDLVIVGIGQAKDDKGMPFLLAAWDTTSDPTRSLHVICKSYAGLKIIERSKILSDARRDGPLLSAAAAPSELLAWNNDPTYEYFRRSDWVIVEATSFGVRNGHLIDVVMRRIRSFDEKSICEEDIDDYRTIRRYQPEKMGSVDGDDGEGAQVSQPAASNSIAKPKRLIIKNMFKEGVVPEAKRAREEVTTSSLTGQTVCVLQSFDEALRKRCWAILGQFGATVVANATAATVLLIAPSEKHMRVAAAVRKGDLPVIKADWLLRCEENGAVDPWRPDDVILEVGGGLRV